MRERCCEGVAGLGRGAGRGVRTTVSGSTCLQSGRKRGGGQELEPACTLCSVEGEGGEPYSVLFYDYLETLATLSHMRIQSAR